ncbi:MAG: DUF2905 family protein [Bacteroidetes bacterium]|jgi:hypothetical protein|nr:DUF2905 family protein [Bacteroidota bacterium]
MGDVNLANTIARWLVLAGVGLIVIGGLVWVLGRFVNLGQLPGDFSWSRGNVRVYVPLATMIVLSLVLTLLLNLLLRFFR